MKIHLVIVSFMLGLNVALAADQPAKFNPEEASHCYAISAITADMILPADDPIIQFKILGAERAPLWDYELLRSVDGDQDQAKAYKEKSLDSVNKNFRSEDGSVNLFSIMAYVNSCNKKMNAAYPDGHPLLDK